MILFTALLDSVLGTPRGIKEELVVLGCYQGTLASIVCKADSYLDCVESCTVLHKNLYHLRDMPE